MRASAMELEHDESRQGEVFLDPSATSQPFRKFFYIESYGCAMNFADSEVIASLLLKEGYGPTPQPDNAHLILINTCSIRDKAEQTIRRRRIT
jgi:tRNA-2-methylthio-N6-dimethylallyladenosine synthase